MQKKIHEKLDKTDESKIFQIKTIKIITSTKIMNSIEL